MTHARKIEAYKNLMTQKGVDPATACPPLWRLLWSFGLPLPPPLYMGFLPLALFSGAFFDILFGAFAWYMGNKGARTMSLHEAAAVALATGGLFGLSVAWLTRRLARKLGLGSWSAFGKDQLRA